MKIKTRLTGIMLIIAMLVSFVCVPAFSAAYKDPYEILWANSIDGATKTGYNVGGAFLGSMTNGEGYYFDDVDFGMTPPTYFEVGIGVPDEYAGSVFQLVIDDMDGDVIGEFDAVSSGGFDISLVRRFPIIKKVVGTHRLYIKKASGSPTNIFTLQFFAPLTDQDVYEEYSETTVFTDIADNKYKDEINTLAAFGVVKVDEDNPFYYPDLYITRIEFAKMLYRLLNVDWYDETKPRFSDVTDDPDAVTAVNYLADRGIVREKGTFNPNGFVTFNAALEMVCRALGYETVAEKYGTSNAYYRVAIENGLTEGFSSSGGKLRNSEAAKLIYNAAISEYFSYGTADDEGNFEYDNRELMITKTKGYKMAEGMVNETNNTSLAFPDGNIDFKYVRIGDKVFNTGKTNAKALLGYECEYFYTEANGGEELVYIRPLSNVTVTKIDSTEFDIEEITTSAIKYSDEKKTKTIKLEADTIILYNGMAIDSPLGELIDALPLRGSIRYIENPHYPAVVFIDEYTDCLVEAFDSEEQLVVDKITGEDIIYDTEDDFVYCVKNGESVRIKDMKVDDIAMVYISKNKTGGKIIRFVVGGGRYEGNISAIDEEYITIDSKKYKRSGMLPSNVSAGSDAEFYVNAVNEIIYLKGIAQVENVGLYIGSYLDTDNDEELYIKIFTSDNKQLTFPCSEKIFVDGVRAKSYEEGKKLFDNCGTDIDKTPIRYSMTKNVVNMVDTFKGETESVMNTLTRRRQGAEYQYEKSNRVLVNKSLGAVDGILAVDGKFLSIWGDAEDISNYVFSGVTGKTESLRGDLYSYDKEGNYIDLLVVKNRENNYDNAVVFHKKTVCVDDDNDIWYVLECFGSSGEVEYKISKEDLEYEGLWLINYLESGDWIRIVPRGDNEIGGLQMVYANDGKTSRVYYNDAGEEQTAGYLITGTTYSVGSNNQDLRHIVGTVTDKFDDYLEITHTDGTKEFIAGANVSCVKVKEDEEPLTGVAVSSVKKGDVICAYIVHRKTSEIVVFE